MERANGYRETAFLPGQLFAEVADFDYYHQRGLTCEQVLHLALPTSSTRPDNAVFLGPPVPARPT